MFTILCIDSNWYGMAAAAATATAAQKRIKQFHPKQPSLPKYTVKMSNDSIWPTDKTLTGVTAPGQRGPGRIAMKG